MQLYHISNAADRSVSSATATTILGWGTPATRRAKLKEVIGSFNSVTATDAPTLFEIVRYTSAGTSTAVTPVPMDALDPVALCTAFENCSIEPTGPSVLYSWKVSVIGVTFLYQWPLGDEWVSKVSDFIGIRITPPQALTGVRLGITFQE